MQVYVWDGYYARTSPWFLEKRQTPSFHARCSHYTWRNGGG